LFILLWAGAHSDRPGYLCKTAPSPPARIGSGEGGRKRGGERKGIPVEGSIGRGNHLQMNPTGPTSVFGTETVPGPRALFFPYRARHISPYIENTFFRGKFLKMRQGYGGSFFSVGGAQSAGFGKNNDLLKTDDGGGGEPWGARQGVLSIAPPRPVPPPTRKPSERDRVFGGPDRKPVQP